MFFYQIDIIFSLAKSAAVTKFPRPFLASCRLWERLFNEFPAVFAASLIRSLRVLRGPLCGLYTISDAHDQFVVKSAMLIDDVTISLSKQARGERFLSLKT